MMRQSFKLDRRRRILAAVQSDGKVAVGQLSELLQTSEVTIRRDLRELADEGLLQRGYGGAVANSASPPEPPVIQRMLDHNMCKECIGLAASRLVKDGESVFVGSGSTAAYVARHLARHKGLTVVTNALTVAQELAAADDATVVVTGGVMRPSELSLIGHITEQSLHEIRVDKVIIGIPALSLAKGLTNDYLHEVVTDRRIIELAPELIVVADHTKLGISCSAFVAPATRVNTLVTDSHADPAILDAFREAGLCVIVADPDLGEVK
jgi:DeoR/GlpR family transcriptional regulator of sugar metabolism